MPAAVNEVGPYKHMAASGAIVGAGGAILQFLCTTAGTLQITEGTIAGGADIVSQISVVAGTPYPLGMLCPLGAYAVLGGGAVGTFTC